AAANVDDPSALAHLVASTLRLKTEEKQEVLEQIDVQQRLRRISVILNRELFLRQQLKAIQEELGEGDPEQAEIAELRSRLDALDVPDDVAKAANRELARLERLPAAAAEYGVIRTYLDWI